MKKPYTLLVIDDEPEVVSLMRERLEREGYRAICATNSSEALALAVQERPDLILLDILMPHPDGLTLLRQLKAHDATHEIPVIMVTAKGQTQYIEEGMAFGAKDYFIKPFQWQELFRFIRKYLQ